MTGWVDGLLDLPGWLVLLVAGLVVFVEDAFFLGFVIPGETVALLAGVSAELGHVSLGGVLVVVVVAAIAGDGVGYEVGRHAGVRIVGHRVLDRYRSRIEAAQALLARRGGGAVFLGRFIAFFRAVMPFLAGTARMRYRTFLAYNAVGGLVWGGTVVILGYAAGASYSSVASTFGEVAAWAAAGLAVVARGGWRVLEHRRAAQAVTSLG